MSATTDSATSAVPTVSPDREVDNCSCTINSSGEAYWSYFATVTSYSYGINSPGTKHDDIDVCCVIPEGIVFDTVNIGVSYGRTISPDTNADRAFLVFPFGLVDVGNYGSDDVTDSYGKTLSAHGLLQHRVFYRIFWLRR